MDDINEFNQWYSKIFPILDELIPDSLKNDQVMQEDRMIVRYVYLEASSINMPPQRIGNFCQKREKKLSFYLYKWQVNVISNVFQNANMVIIVETGSGKSLYSQTIPVIKYGAIILVISLIITLIEN